MTIFPQTIVSHRLLQERNENAELASREVQLYLHTLDSFTSPVSSSYGINVGTSALGFERFSSSAFQ